MPRIRRRGTSDASGDRRVVEETRQQSLQEVNISNVPNSGSRGDSSGRRTGQRSNDRRSPSSSRHRSSSGRPRQRRSTTHLSAGVTDGRASGRTSRDPSPRNPPGRQVEHQSSLRSLLSTSDDPAEIEGEIMRQILEDGLLDALDLNDIDITQDEVISERIAAAFRQRREERRRERRSREARPGQDEGRSNSAPENNERRQNRPPELPLTSAQQSSYPPVSRPHLIEAVNHGNVRHHRSASQSSARSVSLGSPTTSITEPAATDVTSTVTRSTTDLSTSPRTAGSASDGERYAHRRTTEPVSSSHHTSRSTSGPTKSSAPTTPRSAEFELPGRASQGPTTSSASQTRQSPRAASSGTRLSNQSSTSLIPNPSQSAALSTPILHNQASPSLSPQHHPIAFSEPCISCKRCGKQNIQYDLHYNCQKCEDGNFNICMRCYRLSRGCLHWYGFGSTARQKYERQTLPGGYPSNAEPPHSLTGHRYLRPASGTENPLSVPDDPSKRLQVGAFCDICSAFANDCYWKCDSCNDGEWGYCTPCVNQGRHCTHPLLPLTLHSSTHQVSKEDHLTVHESVNDSFVHFRSNVPQDASQPPLDSNLASTLPEPGLTTISNLLFRPLTISTLCDYCRYPIPPSRTRFHCPKCNNGDYDICTSCYTSLVARGGIKAQDGHQGWRRCLYGHRMVVVGFEDRDGGQKRIVVNDLVGGHTLNEEEVFGEGSTNRHGEASWREPDGTRRTYRFTNPLIDPSRPGGISAIGPFPPDGGVGLRMIAKFTFLPADGVKDELCFPKGAEIREADDINGDWLWGVYCGNIGLIPGNYVQRI